MPQAARRRTFQAYPSDAGEARGETNRTPLQRVSAQSRPRALHAPERELDEKIDEIEALIHAEALADVHRWRWLLYLIAAVKIAFFAFVLVGIVLIVWKYGYGG